jgi:hypothetical protein
MPATVRRNRLCYAIAIVLVIILGIGSRRYPQIFPTALGKYPGDALWTIVVFLLGCTILPRASTLKIAGSALAISYIVELCQLYQAPWIVAIRQTTIGHLLLGSQFAWEDLVAYTVGAAIAMLAELGLFASNPRTK